VTRDAWDDFDNWDQARIDAYIAEQWRASEAGELLEEIPADEVEGMDEIFDELNVEWSLEEHAAAIAQRRRERRRRRAWRTPLTEA
jgi:hypothetical protein